MKRDIRDFLQDILDYSAKAREVLERKPKHVDRFSDEGIILIFCLAMVGEAIKQVPNEIRDRYPAPWKRAAGMRDKLLHDYWGTDMPIVLKTASSELPLLEEVVQQILKDLNTEK
jgi:uncharacterized protein with HEPN domain